MLRSIIRNRSGQSMLEYALGAAAATLIGCYFLEPLGHKFYALYEQVVVLSTNL